MDTDETRERPPARDHHVVLWGLLVLLTAVVAWLVGHAPWVASGFSWPTTEAAPVGSSSDGLSGVRLTIPLVAAFLPSLVAFTLIGNAAAGLVPLAFSKLRRGAAVATAFVVAATTTVVVTLLARSTISETASDAFAGDQRVLDGLVAVVLVGGLAALVVSSLASVQIGLLPLAAAVICGQLSSWFTAFLVDQPPGEPSRARLLEDVANVAVIVVMAAAFVLSVRRSLAWVLLWPVAIAVLWVATPLRIMTIMLAGQLRPSAGLPGSLPEILAAGRDTFQASFWEAGQDWWPWTVALVVGLVWIAVQARRRGWSSGGAASAGRPVA